jgi:hypothetical protein
MRRSAAAPVEQPDTKLVQQGCVHAALDGNDNLGWVEGMPHLHAAPHEQACSNRMIGGTSWCDKWQQTPIVGQFWQHSVAANLWCSDSELIGR